MLPAPGTILQARWVRLRVVAATANYVDVEFADPPRPRAHARPFRLTPDAFAAYAAEAAAR